MAIELAVAYVSIIPSTAKIKPAVIAALRDAQKEADKNPVNVKTQTDQKSLDKVTSSLALLGKSAGGVAAVGAGIAALGGAAGLAAGATAALGAGMAALGGIAATGLITATVGLQGMGDAIKAINAGDPQKIATAMAALAPNAQLAAQAFANLKPQLDGLQKSVQNNLFAGLDQSITHVATVSIPTLQTGMGVVATALNGAAKDFADFISTASAQQGIQAAFQSTATVITQSLPGIKALSSGVLDLVKSAAPAMTSIGNGISSLTGALGSTLSQLAASGQFTTLFNNFGAILTSLGPALSGVVTALVTLANTAAPGITALFTALGPAIQNIAAPLGQLGAALGQGLSQVLPVLSQLIASLATGLQPVLPILATLLTSLGTALLPLVTPLSQITQTVGTALVGAIQALAPAVGPLGTAFATLVSAVAPIVPMLATVASSIIQALAPALTTVFQAFAPFIQQLVSALQPALTSLQPVLAQVAGTLGQALAQALIALAPVLPTIVTAFASILGAVTPLLPILANLISLALVPVVGALTGIVNVAKSVVGFVRDNANVFGLLASIIGGALLPVTLAWTILFAKNIALMLLQKAASIAMAVATNGLAIAQKALNLAMSLNPAGLFIAALAAVVAGVIYAYTHFQTFRDIVNDVGQVFVAIWRDAVLPVWNFVVAAIVAEWTNGLKPMFDAIGTTVSWLWHNVMEPAFNGIGAVIGFVWNSVVKPLFDLWVSYLNNVIAPAVMWLWHNVVEPAFNGLAAVIAGVWSGIIKPAWDALTAGLSAIGTAFNWLWNNVVSPVWTAMGAGIKAINDSVIQPVWQAMQAGLHNLSSVFDSVVHGIGTIWDGLKKIIADPVNFVINTVLNDGIFKAWNAVVGFLHLGDSLKAPHIDPVRLATGGFVSGPGGSKEDKIPAMLSNGEFVLNAATTSRIGLDNLKRINGGGSADGLTALGVPGFQAGGEVTAQLVAGHEFARSMSGKAYLMGGAAPGPTDCSGYMSAIANVVLGGSGNGRWWSTTAFPSGQAGSVNAGGQNWLGGLGNGFSIGVLGGAGSGGAAGHTAGTLSAAGKYAATNVESGGAHNDVMYGQSAAGADNSEFPTRYHLPIADGAFESAGPGGGGGGHGSLWSWVVDHTFKPALNGVESLIPKGDGLAGLPHAVFDRISSAMLDYLKGGASQDAASAGVPGTGPVQAQAQQAFARYGWGTGAEWDAASWIIGHESGWNPTAVNPSSGAFGLAQFLGSTKDLYLPNDDPNPGVQADAMARYIRDRYGDPIAAQAFWKSHNYYDSGGVFPNNSIGINASGKPEAVLTNDQWKLFTQFVQLLSQGKIGQAIGSLTTPAPQVSAVVVATGGTGSDTSSGVSPDVSQTRAPTAADYQSKALDAVTAFGQANSDQLLSDLGGRSSGGAVQELVKAVQDQMQKQIAAQLAQTTVKGNAFIGR